MWGGWRYTIHTYQPYSAGNELTGIQRTLKKFSDSGGCPCSRGEISYMHAGQVLNSTRLKDFTTRATLRGSTIYILVATRVDGRHGLMVFKQKSSRGFWVRPIFCRSPEKVQAQSSPIPPNLLTKLRAKEIPYEFSYFRLRVMLTLWATINIKSTQELRTPPSKHTTPLTPISVHHSHTTWGPPPIDTISTSTYDITQHSMHLDIPTGSDTWNVPSPTPTTEGDPTTPQHEEQEEEILTTPPPTQQPTKSQHSMHLLPPSGTYPWNVTQPIHHSQPSLRMNYLLPMWQFQQREISIVAYYV